MHRVTRFRLISDEKVNLSSIPRVGFTELLPQAIALFKISGDELSMAQDAISDLQPDIRLANSSGGDLGFEIN